MKFLTIQFASDADLSGVNPGDAITIQGQEGTVFMTSSFQDTQPASAVFEHTHTFDAPAGVSGPVITPD